MNILPSTSLLDIIREACANPLSHGKNILTALEQCPWKLPIL